MNQLEILRESLGQCDEIILDALIMRNRIVEDIMAYKEANELQILQPEQEAKQKEWLEKRMEGRRHKDEVSDVFECIRTNSKRIQARKLFNYNIVLIGFMGAGKSTISDFLKNVFAMDVVEMDQIIAQRQGMSISDIFETYGEQYFRDLETNLLIEMQSRSNVVISCGGGTPMRECNVVEMKKNGRVVLLTAKPETILDRVKNNHDRPLIEFIPVARQELVVIVPLDHPLAVKDEVRLEDTIPYKQIIFKKRSGLRQIIDGLFECIGQTPDVAYEIDEDQVAAGFVSNGFGICVAPNIPILQSLNVKILPLVSPSWQRNFYMAMLKNVYHPPVVEAFKKYVIEQAQKEWDYKTS